MTLRLRSKLLICALVLVVAGSTVAILFAKDRAEMAILVTAVATVVTCALTVWIARDDRVRERREHADERRIAHAADLFAHRLLEEWTRKAGERHYTTHPMVRISWRLRELATTAAGVDLLRDTRPAPMPASAMGQALAHGASRPMDSGTTEKLYYLYAHPDVSKILIWGKKGSGKTVALILLLIKALEIRRRASDPDERLEIPTPVFIAMSQWDPVRYSLQDWSIRVVQREYGSIQAGSTPGSLFPTLLREGRIALFLDGLDEMPRHFWSAAASRIAEATTQRIVLTSRLEALENANIPFCGGCDAAAGRRRGSA